MFGVAMKLSLIRMLAAFFFTCVGCCGQAFAATDALPADPFGSVMWKSMAERFFPDGPIVFDDRVRVAAPASAEDQFHVPITVDASALNDVRQIVAVADLNPIPHILTVRPEQAMSFVGFRVKLQQSSPIHVGVQTADGVWHIGGAYIDAAGGGCTAPAAAHGTENWMDTLGITRTIARRRVFDHARMTVKMKHPMDTGLADGIPAFYMSELNITDESGALVAEIDLYEPVSEDPTLTLLPKMRSKDASKLNVQARDTEGNEYRFALRVPAIDTQ